MKSQSYPKHDEKQRDSDMSGAAMNWIREATDQLAALFDEVDIDDEVRETYGEIMQDALGRCEAAFVASERQVFPQESMTSNDAAPTAGSGQVVPVNDRTPDCSEDGRVRASAASIGDTQDPSAWSVCRRGRLVSVAFSEADAIGGQCEGDIVVPLYSRPAITDAEREAVECAAQEADAHQHTRRAATLRGLLERMK